jgi:hypothetical protein
MKKGKIAGLMLISLSFLIILVSAFVYDQASQTTTQTIIDVASLTLSNAALGNIEEGETILYTAANTSAIDNILTMNTGKANVYLHIDTDLDSQSSNYATYQIEVIVDTSPGSLSGTVATLTIANPDTTTGIDLDTAGTYIFDFRVTTAAQLVSSNTPTTVNITVSAENTST